MTPNTAIELITEDILKAIDSSQNINLPITVREAAREAIEQGLEKNDLWVAATFLDQEMYIIKDQFEKKIEKLKLELQDKEEKVQSARHGSDLKERELIELGVQLQGMQKAQDEIISVIQRKDQQIDKLINTNDYLVNKLAFIERLTDKVMTKEGNANGE